MKRLIVILAVIGILFVGLGVLSAQEFSEKLPSNYEIFTKGYVQVMGVSAPGQDQYSAIRAATVIAQRNLLEAIKGVRLYGSTTIRRGITESDIIKSEVDGFLRGAIRCGSKYFPDGHAEVCLKVYLSGRGGVYATLLPLLKEENMLPKTEAYYKPKARVAPPSEIANPCDGLIVDVRDFSFFKPALINRIITKKREVIYDPSKVVGTILVNRGSAGYTVSPEKAKALLKAWGSKNPMTVKAIGVSRLTDAQISDDDASAIFVHDKKTGFLTEAKVVFVLY